MLYGVYAKHDDLYGQVGPAILYLSTEICDLKETLGVAIR